MDFLKNLVKSLSTTISYISGSIISKLLKNSQVNDNISRTIENKPTPKVQQPKVEPSVVEQIKKPKITPTKVIKDPTVERSGDAFLYTSTMSDTFQKSLARTMIRGGIDPQEAVDLLSNQNYSFEDLKEYLLKTARNPKEFFYKLNAETGSYEFDYDVNSRADEIKKAIQDYVKIRESNAEELEEIRMKRIIEEVKKMRIEAQLQKEKQKKEEEELERKRQEMKEIEKRSEKDIEEAKNDENDWLNQLVKSKKTENEVKDVNTDLLGINELEDLFN